MVGKVKKLKRITDRLLSVAFYICILIIGWLVLQITCFTTFTIPSDSMAPTLQAGDRILVNKWIMGARIFNVWDTLEIRNGFYRIRGTGEELGNMAAQRRISALTENDSRGVVMESFPWSKRLGWTIKEFGPLPVPAKGQVVALDSISILFYQHIIRYEQKKELSLRDKLIYLGDSLIRGYRFKENYYFVSGDNMENSRDSRYWGLLPESYIVGKATRIWKSKDPADRHIRWNRVWKRINATII